MSAVDTTTQQALDLHRLGIADQNRALVCAALTGAVGLLVGIGIGSSIRRK